MLLFENIGKVKFAEYVVSFDRLLLMSMIIFQQRDDIMPHISAVSICEAVFFGGDSLTELLCGVLMTRSAFANESLPTRTNAVKSCRLPSVYIRLQ